MSPSLLTTLLLSASLSVMDADETGMRITKLIETISAKETSFEGRRKAEKELKNLPAVKVLPTVLFPYTKSWIDGPAAIYPGGPPEIEKRFPPQVQAAYTLARVWNHHLSGEPSREVSAVLLQLLAKSRSSMEYSVLFKELENQWWVEEAEKPVAALFRDPKAEASTRLRAALCLLRHKGKEYHNEVRDAAVKASPELQKPLFEVLASPWHARETGVDSAVVRLGFALLMEDAKKSKGYSHAYLLACHLEAYLEKTFTPNKNDPKYQGKNGLNEAFFQDTVANAQAWWAKNKSAYD